jgi:phosphoribosylamine--glycine ligase
MVRHRIPTARYRVFDSHREARQYLRRGEIPVVVKADGLAAGKGVIVCHSYEQAEQAVERIMVQKAFGDAGSRVIVEEYLQGEEASILALVDGADHVTMAPSQDHKPVFDGDRGPNTGGMGAYAPAPVMTAEMMATVEQRILAPAISGMAQSGHPFKGVLYAGLMITGSGPRVVEFNCRFGDPEAQAVLPTLDGDLLELLLAAARGRLCGRPPLRFKGAAVCIVLASGGYPGAYETGLEIEGAEDVTAGDVIIFHAGTRREGGRLLTAGGRVLGVTGLGSDVRQAARKAYRAVDAISFPEAHFRTDIAHRALGERAICGSQTSGEISAKEHPDAASALGNAPAG